MYTDPTDLVRIRDASNILNLKPSTVYKYVGDWIIPFIKKGNEVWFSISELNEFVKQRQRVKQ